MVSACTDESRPAGWRAPTPSAGSCSLPLRFGWVFIARAIQPRLLITNPNPNHNVRIPEIEVLVDMPDRSAGANGVVCPAVGLSMVFSPAFKATPALGLTIYGMQSGDYYTITAQSRTGFTIQFFNVAAVAVERTFDWTALGYGRQS